MFACRRLWRRSSRCRASSTAHWHAMMASLPVPVLLTADVGYITLVAADEARRTLMRGFTSVRDMAGPAFSLRRAIDARASCKAVPAFGRPGAMISQTRRPRRLPPSLRGSRFPQCAAEPGCGGDRRRRHCRRRSIACYPARSRTVDAGSEPDQLCAGGGVSSHYDPRSTSAHTLRGRVPAPQSTLRKSWGTYAVAVHALYVARD